MPSSNRPTVGNSIAKVAKEPAFKIEEAGVMGRKIFNDISNGIESLIATSGRIYVEVDLLIKDDNLFKDDVKRTSKLIIEVALTEKPSKN